MVGVLDLILGIGAGAFAGAAIRPATDRAWRWAWGPQRIGTPGQTIAAAFASAVVGTALLIGLTLPLQPFVQTWRTFLTA